MTANTKAMEEALQAAVSRMNRSETNGGSVPHTDPIGLMAAILPKLLDNKGVRDAMLEKIEGLHTDDLLPLREELRLARKQIHRLHKAQDEMMAILRQLSEQQAAVGDTVLHIANQMARIEFVEPVADHVDHHDDIRHLVQAASAPRPAAAQSKPRAQRVRRP